MGMHTPHTEMLGHTFMLDFMQWTCKYIHNTGSQCAPWVHVYGMTSHGQCEGYSACQQEIVRSYRPVHGLRLACGSRLASKWVKRQGWNRAEAVKLAVKGCGVWRVHGSSVIADLIRGEGFHMGSLWWLYHRVIAAFT